MKIYFARDITKYDTPQDNRDKELLALLGFDIHDPNKQELVERYKIEGMQVYFSEIDKCDSLAFKVSANGMITAGVYKEILYAQESGKPVIQIPVIYESMVMSVDDTREYLKQSGKR